MTSLITGVDGFLGANLAYHLTQQGEDVIGAALTRKNKTSLDALKVDIRVEYGDVQDYGYVERLINAYEVDTVYHLAAVSIVRIADANPARAIRTNVMGTLNVLEAASKAKTVKAVLVASSDKAYGQADKAYTEDMPLKPTGAYEVSKACSDHIARLYGAIVVRCANLYGPADLNWSRLVPNSCRRALKGEPPIIHAAAWQHAREWLDVDSAVNAYAFLAQNGQEGESYNVGSGEQLSPGHVAFMIAKLLHAPKPATGEALKSYEIATQSLDSSKIRALGWKPVKYNYHAFVDTVDWYKEYLCAS